MKYAIAIAKAKVREKFHIPPPRQLDEKERLAVEISRAVVGSLVFFGAMIGVTGLFFLFSALVRNHGILPLMEKFISAITG